jgi:hypothetical protein
MWGINVKREVDWKKERERVKIYIQREKMIGSMCESVNERWCIVWERETMRDGALCVCVCACVCLERVRVRVRERERERERMRDYCNVCVREKYKQKDKK